MLKRIMTLLEVYDCTREQMYLRTNPKLLKHTTRSQWIRIVSLKAFTLASLLLFHVMCNKCTLSVQLLSKIGDRDDLMISRGYEDETSRGKNVQFSI